MKNKKWLPAVFFVTTTLIFSSLAFAEDGTVHPQKSVEERISELEQEIQLLKRSREVEKEIQIKKDSETPVVITGKDGFGFKSKDSNFQLKFKGYIQTDGRFYIKDEKNKGNNTFLLRRVRPILEGTVYKYFDFRFMPDFGGGTTTILDAYVDFKYTPKAVLRAGKFKSPFGLERLQSSTATAFTENSLATNLTPNYDLGVEIYGDLFDSKVNYAIGVFNGVADGASSDQDNHDDKDLTARLFFLPFKESVKDWLVNLGLGGAVSFGNGHGNSSATNLASYKSVGQQTFFSYRADNTGTVVADGNRFRFSPQASYYWGPFGLLSEYVWSAQHVTKGTSSDELKDKAWQTTVSYVLTGENATYSGVNPRNNFDPSLGHWGAFELVSRINWFSIDKNAFPIYANSQTSANKAKGWGIGLNWYLNKSLKYVLDFDQTYFDGGRLTSDRETENFLSSRVQVAF